MIPLSVSVDVIDVIDVDANDVIDSFLSEKRLSDPVPSDWSWICCENFDAKFLTASRSS